jgi:hypothetical protein
VFLTILLFFWWQHVDERQKRERREQASRLLAEGKEVRDKAALSERKEVQGEKNADYFWSGKT